MVRRTEESPRARILGAAQRELLEKGPEGLSLRAVARGAGYSPASLYEHFDDRDAILRALAEEADGTLRERLAREAEAGLPPEAALLALGCAYVDFAHEEPEAFRVLFQQLRSRRASTAEPPAAGSSAALVRAAVARALAEKGRPAAEVETVAFGLWALAHGIAVLGVTHLAGFADLRSYTSSILRPAIRGWLHG